MHFHPLTDASFKALPNFYFFSLCFLLETSSGKTEINIFNFGQKKLNNNGINKWNLHTHIFSDFEVMLYI
jgi:hypothetical protein